MENFEKEKIINEQIEHTFERIRGMILLCHRCENCVEKRCVPHELLEEEIAYLKALIGLY